MRAYLTIMAAVTILLMGMAIDAKPVPKTKAEPEVRKAAPAPIPNLAKLLGESNWGSVSQDGRDIFITGHEVWEATGRIRDDGSLLLAWTLLQTGEVCPGVYRIDGDKMRGDWGHSDKVFIESDGSLSGETRADTIYKRAVGPPPIN